MLDRQELVSRLRGTHDDHFRGAMAECLVAWYFMTRRRMKVVPHPEDSASKNVDLAIHSAGSVVYGEVKAPFVPVVNRIWSGGEQDRVLKLLQKAAAQCKPGRSNLVILVPVVRSPIFSNRFQILNPTIGEHVIHIPIRYDGNPPLPPRPGFNQTGKLAKLLPGPGGVFTTDLTRISALMSIEETLVAGTTSRIRLSHNVVVIHNPFAQNPIPRTFFGRVPQLVRKGGIMRWTDHYSGI